MRQNFQADLAALKEDLLQMGTLVEERISEAVTSLSNGDLELAQSIVDRDDEIDRMNLEIEKKCLTLIALQQPIARDLRAVGTALKIVTDLERMADHAADIAKVTIRLHGEPLIKPLIDIPRMAELARRMTRESLRAFVEEDAERARRMIELDDEVDHLYSQIFRELLVFMMEDPRTIHQATYLLFVAQYLERVADHATNLGEWIIYLVTGELREMND
jgi:phosphate transport system protein